MRNILILASLSLIVFFSCKKDEATTPKPIASFIYTGGACTAPCAVLFENKSTNAVSYFWEFGDGTTTTETNPTHTYSIGNTYTVKLTAYNSKGDTATSSKQILIQKSIQSQLPKASFTFSGGDCNAPCSVTFNNTSIDATSYQWDFGDGSTGTDKNPVHQYSKGGTFTVKLKAINQAGFTEESKTVTIKTLLPVANFSFSGGNCNAPCEVFFTNLSTNATSYQWDFGDGQTSTENNPSNYYINGGTYTVKLIAKSATGQSEVSKTVTIKNAYTKMIIKKVYINSCPISNFDPFDGPDIFYNIVDKNSVVYSNGQNSYVSNITAASFPLLWTYTTPFTWQISNGAIFFDLWDYDTVDPNDYINYAGFDPKYYLGLSPITFTQNNITMKVEVEWQ